MSERSIPWRSSTLQVIIASSMIGVMGVSLISPVLPDLRTVFGISDAQVGLVITVYTLPGVFLTPFVGLIADRLGRRRVLIPLLVTFGIAGSSIAFAETFLQVLVLRFVQGVGASALVTLSVTLIGDYYEEGQRNAIMGINGSALGFGAALYPIIGGGLAVIRWSAPFWFFATGVGIGLLGYFVLEEPPVQHPLRVREYAQRMRTAVLLPEAIGLYVAVFGAFFLFYGAVLTALPLVLSDEYGFSASQIGVLLSMVSVASAGVSSQYGRISSYMPGSQLIALGFVAYGMSLFGVWLADSPLLIGAMLLGFGIGFGLVMPSLDTTIVSLVSGRLRAGMMGVRTSMLRLGQTLGPVAFTVTAETVFATPVAGYRTLMVGAAVVSLAGGSIAFLRLRAGILGGSGHRT